MLFYRKALSGVAALFLTVQSLAAGNAILTNAASTLSLSGKWLLVDEIVDGEDGLLKFYSQPASYTVIVPEDEFSFKAAMEIPKTTKTPNGAAYFQILFFQVSCLREVTKAVSIGYFSKDGKLIHTVPDYDNPMRDYQPFSAPETPLAKMILPICSSRTQV